MANSVDPDETPRSAASHLGLYCLLKPVCPNTYGKYGSDIYFFLFLHENICCGYSCEAPEQGTTNEYPQRFQGETRKLFILYPHSSRPRSLIRIFPGFLMHSQGFKRLDMGCLHWMHIRKYIFCCYCFSKQERQRNHFPPLSFWVVGVGNVKCVH